MARNDLRHRNAYSDLEATFQNILFGLGIEPSDVSLERHGNTATNRASFILKIKGQEATEPHTIEFLRAIIEGIEIGKSAAIEGGLLDENILESPEAREERLEAEKPTPVAAKRSNVTATKSEMPTLPMKGDVVGSVLAQMAARDGVRGRGRTPTFGRRAAPRKPSFVRHTMK